MVRHDGFVKVLDFGIARLTRPTDANADEIFGHTATGTMPGVLMGTFRYMSPEQIRGEAVGPPTDVFSMALGLVRTVDKPASIRRRFDDQYDARDRLR